MLRRREQRQVSKYVNAQIAQPSLNFPQSRLTNMQNSSRCRRNFIHGELHAIQRNHLRYCQVAPGIELLFSACRASVLLELRKSLQKTYQACHCEGIGRRSSHLQSVCQSCAVLFRFPNKYSQEKQAAPVKLLDRTRPSRRRARVATFAPHVHPLLCVLPACCARALAASRQVEQNQLSWPPVRVLAPAQLCNQLRAAPTAAE